MQVTLEEEEINNTNIAAAGIVGMNGRNFISTGTFTSKVLNSMSLGVIEIIRIIDPTDPILDKIGGIVGREE